MEKYAVITADVIGSKKIDQDLFRNYIDEFSLAKLNSKIKKKNIKVDTYFVPSRGDEVQIICRNFGSIPQLIRLLRYFCRPIELRIGIGIGEIPYFPTNQLKKEIEERDPWVLNGEAFFNARKAIGNLGHRGIISTYCVLPNIANIRYGEMINISINTILELIDHIVSNWTDSQWDSIMAYDEFGKYEVAAQELNISPQGVYNNCRAANWKLIKSSEEKVSSIFLLLEDDLM